MTISRSIFPDVISLRPVNISATNFVVPKAGSEMACGAFRFKWQHPFLKMALEKLVCNVLKQNLLIIFLLLMSLGSDIQAKCMGYCWTQFDDKNNDPILHLFKSKNIGMS